MPESSLAVLSAEQLRDLTAAITKAIAEQPGALTAAHAAAYLDMAERTFRRLVSAKKVPDPVILPGFGTNGKAKRWLRRDLDAWLDRHKVGRRR